MSRPGRAGPGGGPGSWRTEDVGAPVLRGENRGRRRTVHRTHPGREGPDGPIEQPSADGGGRQTVRGGAVTGTERRLVGRLRGGVLAFTRPIRIHRAVAALVGALVVGRGPLVDRLYERLHRHALPGEGDHEDER